MGMSTYVQAFISPDDPRYQKHKKVLEVCCDARVSLPKETADYFQSTEAELFLLEEKLEIKIPYSKIKKGNVDGYEILVKDIPQGTYKIRFCNSW